MDIQSYDKQRIRAFIVAMIAIMIAIVVAFISLKTCSPEPKAGTTTKSDTVYVEKIIKIPAISEEFESINPKPKDGTVVYNKELLIKYQELKTENERLKAFENLSQIRTYDTTYTSPSGLVSVNVLNNVTGFLDYQKVKFDVKEQEVKYTEKTITNTVTEKLKPSFIISGGVSVQTNVDQFNTRPAVGATIGFKNKSGYTLDINYNTQDNVMVIVKKDIFTFWSKKE